VPEDYVHRIGRTGRAGREGEALSLVSPDESGLLRDIERLLGRSLPREVLPGYEAGTAGVVYDEPREHERSAPNTRQRNGGRGQDNRQRQGRGKPQREGARQGGRGRQQAARDGGGSSGRGSRDNGNRNQPRNANAGRSGKPGRNRNRGGNGSRNANGFTSLADRLMGSEG